MVITPSTLDSEGIRDTDGNMKWYVKFGDGDGETPARYATHNPDYNIQANTTGRVGTTLRQRVFVARGFRNPSEPVSEWYTLWERPDLRPPIVLANRLREALDAFTTYNLATAAGIAAAVTNLNTRIPAACANPPP